MRDDSEQADGDYTRIRPEELTALREEIAGLGRQLEQARIAEVHLRGQLHETDKALRSALELVGYFVSRNGWLK